MKGDVVIVLVLVGGHNMKRNAIYKKGVAIIICVAYLFHIMSTLVFAGVEPMSDPSATEWGTTAPNSYDEESAQSENSKDEEERSDKEDIYEEDEHNEIADDSQSENSKEYEEENTEESTEENIDNRDDDDDSDEHSKKDESDHKEESEENSSEEQGEVSDNEISQNEVSQNEVSQNEAKSVSENAEEKIPEDDLHVEKTIKAEIYKDAKYTPLDKDSEEYAAEKNTTIRLNGIMPKTAYAKAYPVSVEIDEKELVSAYDISIFYLDDNNEEQIFQPDKSTGNIRVDIMSDSIREAIKNENELSVYHAENDEVAQEEIKQLDEKKADVEVTDKAVSFDAESFSVYAVVKAPDPYVPGAEKKVASASELAGSYDNSTTGGKGFYISYIDGKEKYCTSTLNNNNAFAETESIAASAKWFFEDGGAENTYYIYTYISNVKRYMHNSSGNLMALSESDKTAFVITDVNESDPDGKLFFKVSNVNKWFQHSGSGKGMRLYTDNDNVKNARLLLTYAYTFDAPDDYYELDGKTYSLAYHEESVKGAGLTSTETNQKGQQALEAISLLVRPDVLSHKGELLISETSDLAEWTFTNVGSSRYYMTTQIGGAVKYLKLDGSGLTLSDAPASVVVEAGTDENDGKYRFSNEGRSLTLMGGKADNGFVSSSNGGEYCWLSLVSKSPLLQNDDFQIYSAEKVDLANNTQVPDGQVVVIYTRLWNPTTKKYEFYAINHDGTLIRCFESGDMIQWVGSTVNTALWKFTEYYYDPAAVPKVPNYYYQLENTYSGDCLRPQSNGGILRNETNFPNYFNRSINLNGRRYGYYYSTVLAWDDDSYSYIGIKIKDDYSGIETCAMGDSESFYFAVMKENPEHASSSEYDTVTTVDHEQYGISVKMADLNDINQMNSILGSTEQGAATTELHQGYLSTNIGNDGYPTVTNTGGSFAAMYAGAKKTNHLFIENTYYSSGYYEYDSTQNFASFYKKDGTYDPNNFTVYTQLGTNDLKSTDTMKHSQFLPYNKLSDTYAVKNPYNLYDANAKELPDSNPRKGERLHLVDGDTDYNFAVELETFFTQTPGGNDAWGHDIIYEFTGDDDFWLYVDGELIIDLGGIHSAVPGSVNYRTGEVMVNGKKLTLRGIFEDNFKKRYKAEHGSDPSQAEIDEFLANYFEGDATIFKDYTDHTMRIFYLERGRGASNLHMRFNLAAVKPGTVELQKVISGIDTVESFIADYPFQIFYKTNEEGAVEQQLTPGMSQINVKYKDTTRNVTYLPTYTASDGVTTYNNVFVLKPSETAVIKFPDDTFTYRVVECFVDKSVYDKVYANGVEISGTDAGQAGPGGAYSRADYDSGYGEVLRRSRLFFTNAVDPNAKGTLTFVKHLYDETGNTQIPNSEDNTSFTFRLYLGTENDPDNAIPLADMHSYHVKDAEGHYCYWDTTSMSMKSYSVTNFDDLSPEKKKRATFNTSMSGTIANIPVDYTVEVREIVSGTKYKVEEREKEIPDGYSLQYYLSEAGDESTRTEDPVSGRINAEHDSEIEIRNLKGWGLRVNKEWSDKDWMTERDPAYFAVYKVNGGSKTLVSGTVKRLAYGDTSVYWLFNTIDDIDHDGVKDKDDFNKYEVREVKLTGGTPTVDPSSSVVTNADSLTKTPIAVDGSGQFELNGKQVGESTSDSYTYKCVKYEKGELPDGSNVRLDTMINKRPGLNLYLTKWDGTTPLAGGTFNLKDSGGTVVDTFTSDADGLITIAYLHKDEDYTLEQTRSTAGYIGMVAPITIRCHGTDVTVNGGDSNWYIADDRDETNGMEIRIGKITIKNKPVTLTIKKTLPDNTTGLDNVTFALYRQVAGNDGNPRRDYTPIAGYDNLKTAGGGIVPLITERFESGALVPNTYYLYETYPLDGFAPLEGDVVFTYSNNGEVTLGDHPSGVTIENSDTDGNQDVRAYTIVVPNRNEGRVELTVKKIVENGTTRDINGGSTFNFTVKLYMPNGLTPWDSYTGDHGEYTNGTMSFALAHNAEKAIEVPLGAVVRVTEDANAGYTVKGAEMNVTASGTTTTTCDYDAASRTARIDIKDQKAVTLTYTNTRKTVNVKVQKKVEGEGGTFNFTATLKDADVICNGYTLNNTENLITDSNGQASFTLSPAKNGQKEIILTIPYGSTLKVEETEDTNYKTKVTYGSTTNESREYTLEAANTKADATIKFTNTERLMVAPTLYRSDRRPFVFMVIFGTVLAIGIYMNGKRKREEDEK